jgi:hypothetical protein
MIGLARERLPPPTAPAKMRSRLGREAAITASTSKFTGRIAPLCLHGSPLSDLPKMLTVRTGIATRKIRLKAPAVD